MADRPGELVVNQARQSPGRVGMAACHRARKVIGSRSSAAATRRHSPDGESQMPTARSPSTCWTASVTIPAGSSRVEPGVTPAAGVTLSWPTFTDAADQAGRSRRYGGIHFQDGDLAGRTLGGLVGARTWQAASELFAGRHHPGGTAA